MRNVHAKRKKNHGPKIFACHDIIIEVFFFFFEGEMIELIHGRKLKKTGTDKRSKMETKMDQGIRSKKEIVSADVMCCVGKLIMERGGGPVHQGLKAFRVKADTPTPTSSNKEVTGISQGNLAR